jgi:dihydroorotase
LPKQIMLGSLAIRQGRICCLGTDLSPNSSTDHTINGDGLFALPGLVDSHVHCRWPGLTQKERWEDATRAALAGGVTCLLDMPNTQPPTTTAERLRAKAAYVRGRAYSDYGFYLGVEASDHDASRLSAALATLQPGEAAGVKIFLAGHHTASEVIRDAAALASIFRVMAKARLPLCIHAEDQATFDHLDSSARPPRTLAEYERLRPRAAALIALRRIIELISIYETSVHILHVSTDEELELLCAARQAGLPLTFECCPQHLLLSLEDERHTDQPTRLKLSPALRTPGDQAALWRAIIGGDVPMLGSDHAPHSLAEKSRAFPDAPPGMPQVQELLPAILTGLAQWGTHLSIGARLQLVAQLLADAPAQRFGLGGKKGRLEPGYDADLVLLQPQRPWRITREQLFSACRWSVYEGRQLIGSPEITILHGKVVYQHGVFNDQPTGQWATFQHAEALGSASVFN